MITTYGGLLLEMWFRNYQNVKKFRYHEMCIASEMHRTYELRKLFKGKLIPKGSITLKFALVKG